MRRVRLLRELLTRLAARRAGAACVALLVLTGCSWSSPGGGGSAGPAEPGASEAVLVRPAAQPEREAEPATGSVLRSRVTRVAGHLSDVRRDSVARRAGAVVAGYLAGAFSAEGDPFRAFTPQLRRAAASDGRLLTGTRDVEVSRARAWFSVAAPAGRPVGLTARLAVQLADGERTGTMTGRFLMTRSAGGEWRVFGYDVARSTDAGRLR